MKQGIWLAAFFWFLPLGACHRARGSSRYRAPAIRVRKGAGQIFVYRSGDTFATVDDLDKVPDWARGWVRVLDPKTKAPAGLAYVANLCKKRRDGTYPYRVVLLQDFESTPPKGCSAGAQPPKVVLYMSTTCPVCAKARAWLQAHGVPFEAKYVDQDPTAAKELAAKAAAQGIPVRGVPVLDVGGTLLPGFDEAAWTRLLGTVMGRRSP